MPTRVTRKAWFGPRRLGWGLSPASWEGWLTTVVCLGGFAVGLGVWRNIPAAIACMAVLTVALLLTSDPPGGRSSRPS
jgi:hypothetical protein